MWQYFYLKFANQEEALAALVDLQNVDHVGAIEGLEGWHVNLALREELPEALQAFQVFPDNPVRVWA
jgi:hypothetical protein